MRYDSHKVNSQGRIEKLERNHHSHQFLYSIPSPAKLPIIDSLRAGPRHVSHREPSICVANAWPFQDPQLEDPMEQYLHFRIQKFQFFAKGMTSKPPVWVKGYFQCWGVSLKYIEMTCLLHVLRSLLGILAMTWPAWPAGWAWWSSHVESNGK